MSQQAIDKRRESSQAWWRANPTYGAEYRRKKVLNGICRYCSVQSLAHADSCERHWFTHVARKRLGNAALWVEIRDKLIAQNYQCPYTGEKLVLGVNASLDHIKPKSKFEAIASDLENVEWVRIDVNFAKRAKSKEDFILMCRTIAAMAKET